MKSASVEQTLTQALLPAPMFAARWRWNATRALAILRFSGGRKVPPQLHAHARRRSAGGGLSRSSRLSRESHRADSDSRSRAGARDDRELSARGDGSRRLRRRFCATIESGAMRTVPSTRPSRRSSATRSSTPIRLRISTTRRSKSAARGPCSCAARCATTLTAPACSIRPRSREVARGIVAGRSRRRRAARRARDADRRAAGACVARPGSTSSSRRRRRDARRAGGGELWTLRGAASSSRAPPTMAWHPKTAKRPSPRFSAAGSSRSGP